MMDMEELSGLDGPIDEDSYQWMEDNQPILLKEIIRLVKKGATPDQIYGYVFRRTERTGISRRCQQAARHLRRQA